MSEVLKRGLPVLQRFAGLGKYLPKGAIRNNAYAAALFTPLDVAGNFMEGKNPIRAVGRPLFQLGGGIGGGGRSHTSHFCCFNPRRSSDHICFNFVF